MSVPGRRNLAGSLSKLSGGVQRIALTRVASPFARERGRVRVAPSEWCRLEGSTPHLSPLPVAKGRGETNTIGPTTGRRTLPYWPKVLLPAALGEYYVHTDSTPL